MFFDICLKHATKGSHSIASDRKRKDLKENRTKENPKLYAQQSMPIAEQNIKQNLRQ